MKHLLEFFGGSHGGQFGWIDGELNEFLEDIIHRLIGGMHHVFFIETVVAKLVEEDLVSREIMGVVEVLAHLIHRQQQSGFAKLVLVKAVFQVAQGRDGEDELLVGNSLQQIRKQLDGLLHREEDPFEVARRKFMTVGNHTSSCFFTINPRGAQADDDPSGRLKMLVCLGKAPVDRLEQRLLCRFPELGVMREGAIELPSHFDDLIMSERGAVVETFQRLSDAGGVVQHAERVDLRVEAHATAEAAHLIGETGA